MEMVYIRMRHRAQATKSQTLKIGDVAQIVGTKDIRKQVSELTIHQVKREDKKLIVIDIMKVIQRINQQYPNLEVQTLGEAETIVEVILEKQTFKPLFFTGVWVLLFIGAGLAVMNFHEDVGMQQVHQKLYEIVTGNENPKPLMLQIPYSFGLGIGMILFFNHLFKKRINEEPSPLEVEMFQYQKALDQYISIHENSEREKKMDDY